MGNDNALTAIACLRSWHGPLETFEAIALGALSSAQGNRLGFQELWKAMSKGATGAGSLPLACLKLCCRSLALKGEINIEPNGVGCSLTAKGKETAETALRHRIAWDGKVGLDGLVNTLAGRLNVRGNLSQADLIKAKSELTAFLLDKGAATVIFAHDEVWPGEAAWEGAPGVPGFVSRILRSTSNEFREPLYGLAKAVVAYLSAYGYRPDDFATVRELVQGTDLFLDAGALLRLLGFTNVAEREAAGALADLAGRYGCCLRISERAFQQAQEILKGHCPTTLLDISFFMERADPDGKDLAIQADRLERMLGEKGVTRAPWPVSGGTAVKSGLSDAFGDCCAVLVTAGYGAGDANSNESGLPRIPDAILAHALWAPTVPGDDRLPILDLAVGALSAMPSLTFQEDVKAKAATIRGLPGAYDAAELFIERLESLWDGLSSPDIADVANITVISESEMAPFQAYSSQVEVQQLSTKLDEIEKKMIGLEGCAIRLGVDSVRWPVTAIRLGLKWILRFLHVFLTLLMCGVDILLSVRVAEAFQRNDWPTVVAGLLALVGCRILNESVMPRLEALLSPAAVAIAWRYVHCKFKGDSQCVDLGLVWGIIEACTKKYPLLASFSVGEGEVGKQGKQGRLQEDGMTMSL